MSTTKKLLLTKAACFLLGARLAITVLPFRSLRFALKKMAGKRKGSSKAISKEDIAWAVETASRHIPGTGNCLVKAIAALTLLRLECYPAALYIGVSKKPRHFLEAHAWTESEGNIVTGSWTQDVQYEPLAGIGDGIFIG